MAYVGAVGISREALRRHSIRLTPDKCVAHSGYDGNRHDIALLRIPKGVLSKPPAEGFQYNSICLAEQSVRDENMIEFEIAGYGTLGGDDKPASSLHKGKVFYVSNSCSVKGACLGYLQYSRDSLISDGVLCQQAEAADQRLCSVSKFSRNTAFNSLGSNPKFIF